MTNAGTIREVLNHKGGATWSVSPENTVFEAIQLMAEKNIGALLVLKDGQLAGIISERDYTRKVALKGRSSKDTERSMKRRDMAGSLGAPASRGCVKTLGVGCLNSAADQARAARKRGGPRSARTRRKL